LSREERAVHRYPGGGSEDIRITKSLSNWLSVSRLPDSLVDGGAFLEFVYKLNPGYKVPSRPHISSKYLQYAALTLITKKVTVTSNLLLKNCA
jgi:hypothetical protein